MLFFKQKTAYEVRISDWSSDVCSSDLRKKLEAANAIVRPNTIWISLRNPPDVSPKASARPVAMMMMTATMRATGPWMDSRMDCSGPSHGIEEPAACAVPDRNSSSAASSSPCSAGRARLRKRARLEGCEGALTETRKAGTVVCVMAVPQVRQGVGKSPQRELGRALGRERVS